MRVKDNYIIDKSINNVYATGDIHGNFKSLIFDITDSCKYKNSIIICCGDIGLGFDSENLIYDIFTWMENKLNKTNNYLVFFRGNHDDPYWFNYKEDRFLSEFNHIIIAEDFSLLNYKGENILLWGGGISIDRTQRTPNYSYWNNEAILPLPDKFKETYLDISIVCSHEAPSDCLPYTKDLILDFCKIDPGLDEECSIGRDLLSYGFINHLSKYNSIKLWIYGHYHNRYINYIQMNDFLNKYKNTRFIGLDMFRLSTFDKKNFKAINAGIFERKHSGDYISLF